MFSLDLALITSGSGCLWSDARSLSTHPLLSPLRKAPLGIEGIRRRIKRTLANGTETLYQYDNAGQMTNILHRRSDLNEIEQSITGSGNPESRDYMNTRIGAEVCRATNSCRACCQEMWDNGELFRNCGKDRSLTKLPNLRRSCTLLP